MSWYDLIDKNGTAVIPDGTVEIPENVYSHCGTLKSVILSNSVRVIGRHAFDSCGSLESAVLPDGLVEVGDYAFRLCHSYVNSALAALLMVYLRDCREMLKLS